MTALLNPTPLTKLPVRETPKADAMITAMRNALQGAYSFDFFARMELNHDTRFCFWQGQTPDGRRWNDAENPRRLCPGEKPGDVFPWPGAPDNRVPLIEEIINERVTIQRLANARKQQRVGPRNLSPDEDPQKRAVLWSQTSEYYDDVYRETVWDAVAQWVDIAEEYGHGIVYVGWDTLEQVVERTMTAEELFQMVAGTILQIAEAKAKQKFIDQGGDPENAPESFLTPEEQQALLQEAGVQMQQILLDPTQKELLVRQIMAYDEAIPLSEARRVASQLKLGGPVTYYAVEELSSGPDWKALTPFIDVFYPATTTRLDRAEWIAMAEWVSEPELQARIDTKGYNEAWVKSVLTKPGQSFNMEQVLNKSTSSLGWVLSNGQVRTSVKEKNEEDTKLFQILHHYSRPTALGNVRALYHTVLHGQVTDSVGHHECCEYAHGKYPFVCHKRERSATMILASRGVGEVAFTYQNEVKTQRDMRGANASMVIKPPVLVPLNRDGGRVDLRPGVQIPYRSNAGMGSIAPLTIGGDPRSSQEVEETTVDALNSYFVRGPKIDPEIKLAYRQMLSSDFLASVREARLLQFQLIQEFSPDELKASFVGGMPVDLQVSREEIQGQVSLELEYDVTEMDPTMVEKKLGALANMIRPLDNQGLLNTGPILKAATAMLFPSWYKLLVADPNAKAVEEAEQEKNVVSGLLNGLESAYVPGQNHTLRLEVMKGLFGIEADKKGNFQIVKNLGKDGQPSRAQKILMEDQDVGELVSNRVKFHSFQIQQQTENAQTGRLGVEPLQA